MKKLTVISISFLLAASAISQDSVVYSMRQQNEAVLKEMPVLWRQLAAECLKKNP